MRDMHDGIGSQLLGLLIQAKGKAPTPAVFAQGLQESLDDLNLVVESLDQADHGLAEALGAFRTRIAPKCDAAGIALEWDMDDLPPTPHLGPARVLHIYRILQEACINAIRHGKPNTIWIASIQEPERPGGIAIRIEDDGSGFDTVTLPESGRGLRNMRRRAEAAGGSLAIERTGGRTRLTLRLDETASH
jgi:signal transduction histidine kinase